MDRNEALRLLRGGQEGIAEWNRRRLEGAKIPSLSAARVDLRGAKLMEADLSHADLRAEDLRGADLRGADLSHADLRHADLSHADLSHADLRWADLSNADLRGADLGWANLEGAIMSRVSITGNMLATGPPRLPGPHLVLRFAGASQPRSLQSLTRETAKWADILGNVAEVAGEDPRVELSEVRSGSIEIVVAMVAGVAGIVWTLGKADKAFADAQKARVETGEISANASVERDLKKAQAEEIRERTRQLRATMLEERPRTLSEFRKLSQVEDADKIESAHDDFVEGAVVLVGCGGELRAETDDGDIGNQRVRRPSAKPPYPKPPR